MNKHDLHCKEIAEELRKYCEGVYWCYQGDIYEDIEFFLNDDGFYYAVINDVLIPEDEFTQASLYDYFTDIFNTEWILDSNKEVIAVRIMIAYGGPNIYINTWDKQVELYWWGESGKYNLDTEICDTITELFTELFW